MKKVEIKWHPYPQEKPKEEGEYLVTLRVGTRDYVKVDNYLINKKHSYFMLSDDFITAWAEKPKPYEDMNNV